MASTPEKVGFKQRISQIMMAFRFVRGHDRLIIPLMIGSFLGPIVIGVLVAIFTGIWLIIPLTVVLAALLALVVFSRRVQRATYAEVDGKPGAAAAVLDTMRGNWHVTPAVAVTAQQDVVHRVVGRPGVILLSEGSAQRLKSLLSQEKKRISRVIPDVPLYDVVVGEEEGQIPLRKLQSHLVKLPRNITPKQISAVEQRLQALGAQRPPIPKGPMPNSARAMKGAKQQMYRGR